MKKYIVYSLCLAALVSSCHIYKPYERPEVNTSGLYRDAASTDTTSIGNLPWKEVFTDTQLQTLIEKGLQNNLDLQMSTQRVKQAEAMMISSRLSFLPGLSFVPQATFTKGVSDLSYQLPVTASWEIDIFGKLMNAKRGNKASLLQSIAYQQAARSQVVSGIANAYYTLLMLDQQLAVSQETSSNWKKNVETMRALKEAGRVTEAAVTQSEANSYMVEATLPDLRRQIRETENALCLLLGETSRAVERNALMMQKMPQQLHVGIPMQLLANRPDVEAAEQALANAYYATNQARSMFYPQIVLSGNLGWINPGNLIVQAVGALTQPLFAKGTNIARLKGNKAKQEEAMLNFRKTLLTAGNEVTNALFQYETSNQKLQHRKLQINSLEKSVDYTQQLLTLGTTTYLEVITAQQSLLSAQLSEISDKFQQMQSIVNLYKALGGGR